MTPRPHGRCTECGQDISGRAAGDGFVILRPHSAPDPRPGDSHRRVECLPRFTRRVVRRLPDPAPVS